MKKFVAQTAAILLAVILIFSSCGNSTSYKKSNPKPFPYVSAPLYLADNLSRDIYIAKNYWKPLIDSSRVFSKDTSLVGGISKESFMKGCIEYASIVYNIPLREAIAAQRNFISSFIALQREEPNNTLFEHIISFAENIFYGVNSNYRNEELYLPVAEALSDFELLDEATRRRYKREAINCSKNRIGERASDFTFTTKEGKRSSLYQTKGEYTILFFSNPGCTACKEIIDELGSSLLIQKLISEKRLNVINIYIDENLSEWYNYMSIYPKEWINCFNEDLSIRDEEIYDIRAIPSLYLLDKDQNSVVKDAPLHILLTLLERMEKYR